MNNFRFLVITASVLFFVNGYSQADCILGVGVTDDATIAEIFQFNELQNEKLKSLSADLKFKSDELNNELVNIKDSHPQSSVTELRQLADKYKGLMDSLGKVQATTDKKMLALFNPKQYELYQSLCKEAYRSPYIVAPSMYTDSIVDENR
ncbi:hypothetical protein [uncultured Maribacter sp.]|uniref:hypothetical protein n=1 Tax=uncultured Maribacter sp. TaxID=431308 RepID=UPI00263A05F1|nr:hypothetical protein [uncultured Maribacter sp.]